MRRIKRKTEVVKIGNKSYLYDILNDEFGAQVSDTAVISPSSYAEHGSKIGAMATIGDDCKIGSGVTIGDYTTIWSGCTIYHRAQIAENVTVADNVIIGNDTTIGALAKIYDDIEIGDNCKIPACTTTSNDTRIGDNAIEVMTINSCMHTVSAWITADYDRFMYINGDIIDMANEALFSQIDGWNFYTKLEQAKISATMDAVEAWMTATIERMRAKI